MHFILNTYENQILYKIGLKVTLLKSGPYGGDTELGALITNDKLDYLIFFWILYSLIRMMWMLRRFLE